jgi:DNA-directed RNA polymerase specialized sigma24 family protein
VNRNDYATHSDFCAIFRNHLDHLYLLALILAGDELIAEKCFLAAFDSCAQESRVFRESALSWSRRSVIKNEIRIVWPASGNSSRHFLAAKRNSLDLDEDASLNCLQDLPAFDRFVFVMSVLERYSDRECALLLGCSYADILPARIRAFQQISTREKRNFPSHSSGTQPYLVDADWLECG